MDITVVGGGLAGLTAAVASAERGANVTLLEAHRTLGGRARSTGPPYTADEGPHVLYGDGPLFAWLAGRDLLPPYLRFPARAAPRVRVRDRGRVGAPPVSLLRAAARRRLRAPRDRDFGSWAREALGAEPARVAANTMGVALFDSDPSRLSAAFVWERFLRVANPGWPSPKYLVGGWSSLVERLAGRAREMGVRVGTGERVDALPGAPVIVATSLASARALLGDDSLEWESGHALMADLGLRRGRDPFIVFDADECGFLERYSPVDRTLAPGGRGAGPGAAAGAAGRVPGAGHRAAGAVPGPVPAGVAGAGDVAARPGGARAHGRAGPAGVHVAGPPGRGPGTRRLPGG
nr:NAD(P)-binding protein [Nocardiopsis akebiae]